MEQPENDRLKIINSILDTVQHLEPEKSTAIMQLLVQPGQVISVIGISGPAHRFDQKKMETMVETFKGLI